MYDSAPKSGRAPRPEVHRTTKSNVALRVVLTVALALTTLGADALFSQGQPSTRSRRTVILDGREVVEGEVIVRYRNQVGRIERDRAEFQADSDSSESIGVRGARRMRSRQLTTRQMLAALRANPDIEVVEPNFIIRANAVPNDPSMGSLWGLINTGQVVDGHAGVPGADIGAAAAWNVTTGSRSNIVGIIDTGIDFTHPDLAANGFSAPREFSVMIGTQTITCAAGTRGFNALNNTCVPIDDNGHGTHVAGIVGAVGNNNVGVTGVNWTANLMALKVLGADGTGTTSDAIKAVEFAIKAKAELGAGANVRVLNASWGGPNFSQLLNDEIQAANTADMLFVAAAGSDSMNNDAVPHYPASSTSPNVISVAATDNTGALASFSNFGATSVDLAAPGASTLSTFPNNAYGELSGTSMAAPHVAGAAALVLSVCPTNTATLKSTLLASVDPDASLSGKSVSGGRLNVGAAIARCQPTLSATISGTTITATVGNSTGNTTDWLGLYCPASNADGNYADWKYLSGSRTPPTPGMTSASVTFQAPSQSGMSCNVRLFATNSMLKLATSGTVSTSTVQPTISVTPSSVSAGGALSATVAGGPANTTDWIGLFAAGASNSQYSDWKYLSGTRTPPASGMSGATVSFTAPSTPGTYELRWFSTNTGPLLATSAAITVTGGTPTLTIGDVNITEGNSGTSLATFTVTLSPMNTAQTVTVNYATADGTATTGSGDYSAASGTLSFPASTPSRTFTVVIQGDTAPESNETFVVNLSGATNAVIGDAQAIGTITNDDAAPTPTVTVAATRVDPGGTISFTVANGPANPKDWVALVDASAPDTAYGQWWFLNGSRTSPATGLSSATLQFTAPSTPGTYDVRLFENNGFTRLARSVTITVGPGVTLTSTTVQAGTPIAFTVSGGPANPRDWVALAQASAADTSYGQWWYLNGAKTAPASGLASASLQFMAPSVPGAYEVRWFVNDGFTRIAKSATITVVPGIQVASTTVQPGAPIDVVVGGGPANPGDWVGLVSASGADNAYVQWWYLNGTRTMPASGLNGGTLRFTAPSTPGTYNVRFFADNGFTRLATSATITVAP